MNMSRNDGLSSCRRRLQDVGKRNIQTARVAYRNDHKRLSTVCFAQKKQFKSFDDMLSNETKPVLVDFYATWCGPCQLMSQELERVSVDMKDSLRVVKVDCDRYPNLATKYGIGGLPTVVLFKNGSPVMKEEGFIPANQLTVRLRDILSQKAK